ncbi:hypothetical protein H8957_002973 [Semnopithecus entellus]
MRWFEPLNLVISEDSCTHGCPSYVPHLQEYSPPPTPSVGKWNDCPHRREAAKRTLGKEIVLSFLGELYELPSKPKCL